MMGPGQMPIDPFSLPSVTTCKDCTHDAVRLERCERCAKIFESGEKPALKMWSRKPVIRTVRRARSRAEIEAGVDWALRPDDPKPWLSRSAKDKLLGFIVGFVLQGTLYYFFIR